MEVFTLLKSIQSAREKVGDFPKLYISRKEDGEGKSEFRGGGRCMYVQCNYSLTLDRELMEPVSNK